jgi:hypothetical protein
MIHSLSFMDELNIEVVKAQFSPLEQFALIKSANKILSDALLHTVGGQHFFLMLKRFTTLGEQT